MQIEIPIYWLSRHRNFKKQIWPESLESKMESEFRLRWGSQELEPKIGIPNQAYMQDVFGMLAADNDDDNSTDTTAMQMASLMLHRAS